MAGLAAVSPHIISAVMPLRTYKVGDNRKDDIPSTMAKLQNLKYPFLGFLSGFYSGVCSDIFLVASLEFLQGRRRGSYIMDSRACYYRGL